MQKAQKARIGAAPRGAAPAGRAEILFPSAIHRRRRKRASMSSSACSAWLPRTKHAPRLRAPIARQCAPGPAAASLRHGCALRSLVGVPRRARVLILAPAVHARQAIAVLSGGDAADSSTARLARVQPSAAKNTAGRGPAGAHEQTELLHSLPYRGSSAWSRDARRRVVRVGALRHAATARRRAAPGASAKPLLAGSPQAQPSCRSGGA